MYYFIRSYGNTIKPSFLTGLFSLIFLTSASFSQEIPSIYTPVRPTYLGGAFTAIANDEDAIWTNPAGISRIRKARSRSTVNLVRFPAAAAGRNNQASDFLTSMKSGTDSVAASASSIDETKPFWAMAEAAPIMMIDMGKLPSVIGGYSHLTAKALVDKEMPTQASTEIVWDTGGIFSMAWTTQSNRFSIGVQGRYITRSAYEEYVPLTTLIDQSEMSKNFTKNSNSSTGLAVDTGVMLTLADFWFPTIGVAAFNLPTGCKNDYLDPFSKRREITCGTAFKGQIKNPDAVSNLDPTDIRVGVSITPRLARKLALRIGLDAHHLLATSGESNYGFSEIPLQKKLHAGAELFIGNPLLPSPFSIGAGAGQGFASAGGSLRLGFLSFDVAIYGQDVSTSATPLEDRRAIAGFSLDF
ncbi:MAG: hypothetical protein HQK54_13315 [Oligoflexales bacterium]|nr:hypothetical protein [Oligoflexales bacterium]